MDSLSKISPSSSSCSSKIIENIHTMSWLKQDFFPPENSNSQRVVGKDGKIMSKKKTDEDFFSGTKEEKKKQKKKKEKQGKPVVTLDSLQDLITLTQQSEEKVIPVQDLEEKQKYEPATVQEDAEVVTEINATVWSTTSNTADKLFPNVQSVKINRFEEEEMLSQAIAESIASVQLEQYKRPTPEKEDRWEALYGDSEDEGSWENVRRNLPSTSETRNSREDTSGQRKSCDNNNNSSKPSILRNRKTNLNRYLMAEHDFCFKTFSENSQDQVRTAQSQKSVSFNESIAVKVQSSESSENEESDKILNDNKRGHVIDKFGRVDGYSERRLFMGKGARMKEQQYIQNQCSLEVGDIKSQHLKPNSQATVVIKTEKPAITASESLENLQSQELIPKLENPESEKAIAVKDFHITPEITYQEPEPILQSTAIVETQKLAITTLEPLENLQLRELVPGLENPETEKVIVVEDFYGTPETTDQEPEPNSQSITIIETQKLAITGLESLEDLQSQELVPALKNPETEKVIAVKDFYGTPETTYQEPEPISQSIAIVETQKLAITTSESLENLESQELVPKLENPETEMAIALKDFHKTPEAKYQKPEQNSQPTVAIKSQKPAMSTSRSLKNSQSQKPVPSFENPKTKKAIDTKNYNRRPETTININNRNNVEKLNESAKKSFQNAGKFKPQTSEAKKLKPIERNVQTSREDRKVTPTAYKNNNLSQRKEFIEKRNAKDLQGNIPTQDTSSKDLPAMLKAVDNVSEPKIPEKESEFESRCLVPTLVREEEYTPNFVTADLQHTDLLAKISDAQFQSPACKNLFLAGVSCLDTSCDAQSLMPHDLDPQNLPYQNYPTHGSVPLNAVPLQSQVWNNVQHIQPQYMRSGNEIYQNTLLNQFPNLNYNAYSMLPDYTKMDQTGYTYIPGHPSAQNLPYQNVGIPVNPDHYNTSNFMKSEENAFSNTSVKDSGPMQYHTKVPPHEKTENNSKQFVTTQAPPGVRKTLRLPSGFTRKEDIEPEKEKFHKKKSVPRSTSNSGEKTSEQLAQSKPAHYGGNSRSNTVQTSRSPSKKTQNYYRPRSGFQRQASQIAEERKVPHPILGGTQTSHEKREQSLQSHRDAVINRSSNRTPSVLGTGHDKTSKNSIETSSNNNNNNYLTASTPNKTSDFDSQETSDLSQNSDIILQSASPGVSQIPDELSPRMSNTANWQFNVNFMNPPQMPANFAPYYQAPVPNPYNLPVNFAPDYYEAPMYQHAGVQQLPIHILSPSPEMNPMQNHNCNSNVYDPDLTMGESFEKFNAGRGRGRLEKKTLL